MEGESGWQAHPEAPLTIGTEEENTAYGAENHQYGSAVWNHWLSGVYGPDAVRDAWAYASDTNPPFAPSAYHLSIARHGGEGFVDEFTAFAAGTAEWSASNSAFIGGEHYPDVRREGELEVDTETTVTLDHTAYALYDVPASDASSLRL